MPDPTVVQFKFSPRQLVTIRLFDLNYDGQIHRCIYDGGALIYNVEYCVNGEFKAREFYEDELEWRSTR